MKFIITLIVIALNLNFSLAQYDKKLKKLLVFDFVELEAGGNYSARPEGEVTFYPSQTVKGDTTGVSNDGEYLMFRDDLATQKGELFKLFRLDWVSNWEYEQFITWVKDSTMLEMVYVNNNPTGNDEIWEEHIGEMLIHPDVYYDSINQEYIAFDPSQPEINRELFPLSWTMKGIKDYQIIPLIEGLYQSPYNRFNNQKTFNENMFWYGKEGSGKEILIAPDRDVWAKQSEYPFDVYYNLANYYYREEPSQFYPVIGLLGTQIKAYLDYKEKQIQKELDDEGYDYRVQLSLPTQEEISLADTSDCNCKMNFILEEKDMTDQWQITNEEYWEFLFWVQDSVIRETIYTNDTESRKHQIQDEIIANMLDFEEIYYDEVNLAWQEFDPSQPFINRYLFPFDYGFKWKKKIKPTKYVPLIRDLFQTPEELDSIKGKVNHKDFKFDHYIYKYRWEDLARRSEDGELIWDEQKKTFLLKDQWHGKAVSTDAKSLPGYESGVRRHKSVGDFFVEESVSVFPGANCKLCNINCLHEHGGELTWEEQQDVCDKCPLDWDKNMKTYDFWSEPEALMQNLNYNQALAFFHWKYQRHTWWNKTSTRTHDDLVPTKEQFEKAQKGEQVVIEEQKLHFPNPWFRYVIHVYPKE